MSNIEQGAKADAALGQALQTVARADSIDVIERLVADHPSLASREFLESLDREIDEITRTRRGDWWGLTRACALLRGYQNGALQDALFRCRVRDLLPLGPDDVRRKAVDHPELLSEQADQLLRGWASERQRAGQDMQAGQMELRRGLLREIAIERAQELKNAALEQEREFERSGDLAILDQALAASKHLLRDPGAPFVSDELRLANLQAVSRMLQERYRVAGALQNLDQAVAEVEQGLAVLPERSLVRQVLLLELARSLNLRFRELRDVEDIDRALEIFENLAALGAAPAAEDRLTPQVNVAVALLDRYYAFKSPQDLQRAIDLLRQIVCTTEPGSGRRLLRLNNLASALYLAFRDFGDRAALREAITLHREVVKTDNASFRVHALAAMARSLDMAARAGEADLQEAATVFREACRLGLQFNAGAAMWAGMTWGRAAWERNDLDAAAEAYGYCGVGARLLFSRQSGESSQEIRLSQFREVAARAAFALAAGGRPGDAAVAFELSRAQLLIQAIERGQNLHRATDLDADVPAGALPATPMVRHALDVNDIAALARQDPLVYLLSTDRGGLALLAHQDKITPIPLPELNTRTVEQRVQAFLAGMEADKQSIRIRTLDDTTRWLWDAAMGPILEKLPKPCGIVLVPGGLLGLLPLHAAWTPDPGRPGNRLYALDAAAFSYAPSARALGAARARAAQAMDGWTAGKALVVANPASAGAPPLEFAGDEAAVVKWHFPTAEALENEKAGLSRVSGQLPGALLAHLACHGFAELDTPLRSGMMLSGEDILTVEAIRDLHMTARLAVLSACESAVAGVPLPDEVVAMPTGLLQAGVAGVVASLWPVSDRSTPILMAEFYRRLCREKQGPAESIRGAQQWMRDTTSTEKRRWCETGSGDWLPPDVAQRWRAALVESDARTYSSPLWWAAFVHVGV